MSQFRNIEFIGSFDGEDDDEINTVGFQMTKIFATQSDFSLDWNYLFRYALNTRR